MAQFILSTEATPKKARAIFDPEDALDDRLSDLRELLRHGGLPELSAQHQVHAVAGPEHEHFEAALAAYGLAWTKPCDPKLVTRIIELLVAGEIVEPTGLEDGCLRVMLETGFATNEDWASLPRASDVVARSYLTERYVGFPHDPRVMTFSQLSVAASLAGGLAVAAAEARAEWRS